MIIPEKSHPCHNTAIDNRGERNAFMPYFGLPGLPGDDFSDHFRARDVTVVAVTAIYVSLFLVLLGRGYSGQEAIVLTAALAIAGLEVLRRLPGGSEPGGKR